MKKQIENLEAKYIKKYITQFNIGDTDVHFKVKEEKRTRIQVFSGIVIGRKGRGLNKMFTVRRISYGEGVERIFPIHSPLVERIEVKKKGSVRRAKLYYLRGKTGKKATKVKEKVAQKENTPHKT